LGGKCLERTLSAQSKKANERNPVFSYIYRSFVLLIMNNIIIGRQKELKLLDGLKQKDGSAFVAVFGRRRVGKTFLTTNKTG